MIFLRWFETTIFMHPRNIGPGMRENILRKFYADTEGTCQGTYYILTVLNEGERYPGRVQPGTGMIEFPIKYQAMIMTWFKGEVVEGVVTSVHNTGIVAEVGPMRVFVGKTCIPEDIVYDYGSNPNVYRGPQEIEIGRASYIRMRLIGVKEAMANGQIVATATIKGDFLGVFNESQM